MKPLFDMEPVEPSGKSDEWYTPPDIIKAAYSVMGGIDLDPASCELANQTVKAARYYTKDDNGLAHEWYGRIWLNPPYGRIHNSGASVIRMFITRLVDEYRIGHVKQAVLLTTVQTNSTWFQLLWEYPLCFTSHRVAFLKPINGRIEPDGRTSHPLGTALAYLGPNITTFAQTFSQFGPVVLPSGVIRRPQPPQQPTLWDQEAS